MLKWFRVTLLNIDHIHGLTQEVAFRDFGNGFLIMQIYSHYIALSRTDAKRSFSCSKKEKRYELRME